MYNLSVSCKLVKKISDFSRVVYPLFMLSINRNKSELVSLDNVVTVCWPINKSRMIGYWPTFNKYVRMMAALHWLITETCIDWTPFKWFIERWIRTLKPKILLYFVNPYQWNFNGKNKSWQITSKDIYFHIFW